MKKITILLLTFLTFNVGYSQKNKTEFKNEVEFINRSPLIERLYFDYDRKEMQLKLTMKGIRYVQKDMKNNPKIIARLVKRLDGETFNGKSKLNLGCIASQVYWHCLFYDLNKDEDSKVDNYGAISHLSVFNQLWRSARKKYDYNMPKNTIKTKFGKLSNSTMRSMEVDLTELYLDQCTIGGNYSLPPNIVDKISEYYEKYEQRLKRRRN